MSNIADNLQYKQLSEQLQGIGCLASCFPFLFTKEQRKEIKRLRTEVEEMRRYYVYIMTNFSRHSLYVGVTNDLVMRVAEHKAHVNDGFTAKYDCKMLLYFEELPSAEQAIAREKQLKNWRREWKENLIMQLNPDFMDLSERIGVTLDIVEGIRDQYSITGRR